MGRRRTLSTLAAVCRSAFATSARATDGVSDDEVLVRADGRWR